MVPARAGVVRVPARRDGLPVRGPRASGGGPPARTARAKRMSWAPARAGWSVGCGRSDGRRRGGPWRERGWSGTSPPWLAGGSRWSPASGVVWGTKVVAVRARVVPARAGVVRPSAPRTHGVVPARAGWSAQLAQQPLRIFVVPARAGVVRPCRRGAAHRVGGPRASGGWSFPSAASSPPFTVVPARAGVVRCVRPSGCACPCGPRASGGGPTRVCNVPGCPEWSPRERGSVPGRQMGCVSAVVPVQAGVVRLVMHAVAGARCGPRASGGGPPEAPHPSPGAGCARAGVVRLGSVSEVDQGRAMILPRGSGTFD